MAEALAAAAATAAAGRSVLEGGLPGDSESADRGDVICRS